MFNHPTNSNLSPSNNPKSLNFKCGITSKAIKESVIKGEVNVEPSSSLPFYQYRCIVQLSYIHLHCSLIRLRVRECHLSPATCWFGGEYATDAAFVGNHKIYSIANAFIIHTYRNNIMAVMCNRRSDGSFFNPKFLINAAATGASR